jgi:serine/threonine protein kinase
MNQGYPYVTNEVTDYGKTLLKFGISYRSNDPWLETGDCNTENNWVIYISVLLQYAENIVQEVAPLLYAYNIPFKLLQNSQMVDTSNGIGFGRHEAGKIFIVYPSSSVQAASLSAELEEITKDYQGIFIEDCIRIGKVLYAETAIPFNIPKAYRIKKRKGRIGKYYVPIRLLKFSPRGDINLGVNLKGFAFTPCIIKQARAGSFTDKFNRQAFHKLQWQKTVMEALQGKLPVPGVIDFCKKGSDHFLIIEYIEGETLLQKIGAIHGGQRWNDLQASCRRELVNYFRQIVNIINGMHQLGYMHRDIQINNFIIREGRVFIIDFELAYYIPGKLPTPAFGYGTAGFVAPEQSVHQIPTPAEDVFSLGALLAFMVLHPGAFSGNIYNALVDVELEENLLELILTCMDQQAASRPSLFEINRLLNIYESKNH